MEHRTTFIRKGGLMSYPHSTMLSSDHRANVRTCFSGSRFRYLAAALFLLIGAILLAPLAAEAQYRIEQVATGGGRLRFLNTTEGYSFGSRSILYTRDGGRNWSFIVSDLHAAIGCSGILDAAFVSRSHGWVVAYYGGGINTPIDTTCVFATTDGGVTWKKQLTSKVSATKWASQTFQGLRFADSLNGWVFGLGVIEHTTDGGATWTTQMRFSERTIYNNLFTCGYFKNRSEGWIAGYGGFILHTTDAGDTWVTQHVDSACTPEGMVINIETFYLRAIHFDDSLNGIASSDHGYYLRTTDGGLTWDRGYTAFPHDNADVFVFNEDVIWQVGGNYCDNTGCYAGQSILYSTNGGATWNPVIARTVGLLGTDAQYVSIVWMDSRHGYISDEYGRIFTISDTTAPVAGINIESEADENLLIYPNPVARELNIRFAGMSPETAVHIYDALGRRVFMADRGSISAMTVDMSAFSPGSYMLEVIADGKRSWRKMMVTR